MCVTCLVVGEEVDSPNRSCAIDTLPSDDCPDDNDDTPAPPEGGDEPCDLGCWEPPDDDDDPFNPPGFMSVQSWQTTSSGMAVAVYQPASTDCPGEDDPEDENINTTEVCPMDPLADMQIRPTCSGTEGGRYGGRGGDHNGLDLLAEVGTTLHSIEGGTVLNTGYDAGGWGDWIIVNSDENNRFFVYAHLEEVMVNTGDVVDEGSIIGTTGVSGNACDTSCECGPAHLHLEVREGNTWGEASTTDPENYIGTAFTDEEGVAESDSCEQ